MAREKNLSPMELYETIISDRPEKLDGEEVDYRDSDNDKQQCRKCLHFFIRKIDDYGVCELVRLDDDEPIDPDYVCHYFTRNGTVFPLLK